ncbi:mechanosensitive ion channel domain-containing protein [Aureimonas leprariae]|nr:mechanosensitive ion channel domain-containing protein [Aureimonas leprariae]
MPSFLSPTMAENVGLSLCILLLAFAARWTAERAVSRKVSDRLVARQRRFTMRALINLVAAFALVAVWMSQIQNLVFSLAAVMVALVVATKELIMCVAGAVLRLGGQSFKVGDRVEVGGLHGEVVDHGLFSTTIMEMPAHALGHGATGRRLTLPNSALLAGPVRVEAQPRHFAPHRFVLTLEHPVPVAPALAVLNAAAAAALAPDAERAARFHRMTAAKLGVEVAGPGHEVSVTTSELGKLQFNVMLYCLAKDARDLQQAVTLAFLAETVPLSAAEPLAAAQAASPVRTIPDIWPEIARRLGQQPQQQRRSEAA